MIDGLEASGRIVELGGRLGFSLLGCKTLKY